MLGKTWIFLVSVTLYNLVELYTGTAEGGSTMHVRLFGAHGQRLHIQRTVKADTPRVKSSRRTHIVRCCGYKYCYNTASTSRPNSVEPAGGKDRGRAGTSRPSTKPGNGSPPNSRDITQQGAHKSTKYPIKTGVSDAYYPQNKPGMVDSAKRLPNSSNTDPYVTDPGIQGDINENSQDGDTTVADETNSDSSQGIDGENSVDANGNLNSLGSISGVTSKSGSKIAQGSSIKPDGSVTQAPGSNQLPAGFTLPGGMVLPPGVTLPPGYIPGGAALPAGVTLPPGFNPGGAALPAGVTLPPGFNPGGAALPAGVTLPPGYAAGGAALPAGVTLPPGYAAGGAAPPAGVTLPPGFAAGGIGLLPGVTLPTGYALEGATLPAGVTLPPGYVTGGKALPSGVTLPPGYAPRGTELPLGVTLPPGYVTAGKAIVSGVTLPPGGAALPSGVTLPPGYSPEGMYLPPGVTLPSGYAAPPGGMILPPGVTLPPGGIAALDPNLLAAMGFASQPPSGLETSLFVIGVKGTTLPGGITLSGSGMTIIGQSAGTGSNSASGGNVVNPASSNLGNYQANQAMSTNVGYAQKVSTDVPSNGASAGVPYGTQSGQAINAVTNTIGPGGTVLGGGVNNNPTTANTNSGNQAVTNAPIVPGIPGLPAGMTIPPGMTVPPGGIPSGFSLPPGYTLPGGINVSPDLQGAPTVPPNSDTISVNNGGVNNGGNTNVIAGNTVTQNAGTNVVGNGIVNSNVVSSRTVNSNLINSGTVPGTSINPGGIQSTSNNAVGDTNPTTSAQPVNAADVTTTASAGATAGPSYTPPPGVTFPSGVVLPPEYSNLSPEELSVLAAKFGYAAPSNGGSSPSQAGSTLDAATSVNGIDVTGVSSNAGVTNSEVITNPGGVSVNGVPVQNGGTNAPQNDGTNAAGATNPVQVTPDVVIAVTEVTYGVTISSENVNPGGPVINELSTAGQTMTNQEVTTVSYPAVTVTPAGGAVTTTTTGNPVTVKITTPSVTTVTVPTAPPTTVTVSTTSTTPPPCKNCIPKCPTITCQPNATLFNADGTVMNPGLYGTWKTDCGSQYLISNTQASQEDAFSTCCTLGMRLISFETPEEMNCVKNFNPQAPPTWTSARSQGCSMSEWTWCTASGQQAGCMQYDLMPWVTGEPNNFLAGGEYCAEFKLDWGSFGLNDKKCTTISGFICEGKPSPTPT